MKIIAPMLTAILCAFILLSCANKAEKQIKQVPEEDAFQKKLDSLHEKNLQKNSKKRSKAQELDTLKIKRF